VAPEDRHLQVRPNEWETGHVVLKLASGSVVAGDLVELDGDIVRIEVDGTVTEVIIEETVDLELDLQSPGPE